jgi:ABC-type transporter Mla subunit MlaD
MDINDLRLLRELRRAIDAAAPDGPEAQAAALREVLARQGATLEDVARAVARVKERRRREISALAQRLSRLAEQREEDRDTADAVDIFLRSLGRQG